MKILIVYGFVYIFNNEMGNLYSNKKIYKFIYSTEMYFIIIDRNLYKLYNIKNINFNEANEAIKRKKQYFNYIAVNLKKL